MSKLGDAIRHLKGVRDLALDAIDQIESGRMAPMACLLAIASVADMGLLKADPARETEMEALRRWGAKVAAELGYQPLRGWEWFYPGYGLRCPNCQDDRRR